MAVSYFSDKATMPDEKMTAEALAGSITLWDDLKVWTKQEYPAVTGEWKHYGKAAGWSYKMLSGKRNLLFFVPLSGSFRIRIVLGEKAVSKAVASDLPSEVIEKIREAVAYTEGRSIDIDIENSTQLKTVKQLLKIKTDN